MKIKIVSIILFVVFVCSSVGISSTVLYREQEEIFSHSADIVSLTFNADKKPIISNEEVFLSQIENENNLLYILSHGLPDKGVMIAKDNRVSWDKIAEHVQADILIVDTCFSGQILEQENWSKKPSLIITSTAKDNYSYNPEIVEGYRISLLSTAFFVYFSDKQEHSGIEDYIGTKLNKYNESLFFLWGIDYVLRDIKYLHLKLYTNLIVREDFESEIKRVEDKTHIPFKGLSCIKYNKRN